MTLLQQIRKDQIEARKTKNDDISGPVKASLLTTLYSEAAMIGKNDGNRETTDDEVQVLVKKFIKGIDETLKVRPKATNLLLEKQILMNYLPKQLSEQELENVVREFVSTLEDKSPKSMGVVMKHLKENYSGQYDGKTASSITKQVLSE